MARLTSALTSAHAKMVVMGTRLLAAVFAVCLAASAQTLTVEKLVEFLRNAQNSQKFKYSDQEIAKFLHSTAHNLRQWSAACRQIGV